MNKTIKFASLVGVLSALAGVSANADTTVYQNTTTKLATGYAPVGGTEFGDQIVLATPGNNNAKLGSFSFEYFGKGFSGDETARIRFYANDGAAVTTGTPPSFAPNTVLFDSGTFGVGASTNGTVLTFSNMGIDVPKSFTWTVSFGGVTASEVAGLSRYSPPTVGNNFDDYWEKNGAAWELRKSSDGSFMDFGAAVTATSVPEPSTIAMSVIGGLAALTALARRKK